MRSAWASVSAVALLLGVAYAEEDQASLQGFWSVVLAEKDGEAIPEEGLRLLKVVFAGNTMTIRDGEKGEKADFRLEPAAKPKAIDMIPDGEEEISRGIYELDGDTLRLAWRNEDGARPTEIPASSVAGVTRLILKRDKAE
jgi:uncharacterized protein (TIGR03067 family)